jgi:hypothetical protein
MVGRIGVWGPIYAFFGRFWVINYFSKADKTILHNFNWILWNVETEFDDKKCDERSRTWKSFLDVHKPFLEPDRIRRRPYMYKE